MVLVLREAFALASEHARINGRELVLTDDVVRALKVISHPSCTFIDSLAAPTRAEHAAESQGGLARAVEAIETCALALSVEHVIVDSQGRLRRSSAVPHASEHPGHECVQGDSQTAHTNLFSSSASALSRAANLDLMARADKLFHDFAAHASNTMGAATPVRRAIFNGVAAVVAHLQQQTNDDDIETLETNTHMR